MIICGIDPSLTRAGIAVLTDGQPTVLRSAGWGGHDSDSYEDRSDRVVAQTRLICSLIPTDTDLALIEGPAYKSVTGHAFDRAGLWRGVYAALRHRRTPIAVVAPPTLKVWATGRGHADKDTVHTETRLRWPGLRIRNHDEADALALAEIGAARLTDPLPFPLKTRHHNTLKSPGIAWPATWRTPTTRSLRAVR